MQWQENSISVRESSGLAADSHGWNVKVLFQTEIRDYRLFSLTFHSLLNRSVFCNSCETHVWSHLSPWAHTHMLTPCTYACTQRARNWKGMSGEMHLEWMRWCSSQIYGANILFQSLRNSLYPHKRCHMHTSFRGLHFMWFVFKTYIVKQPQFIAFSNVLLLNKVKYSLSKRRRMTKSSAQWCAKMVHFIYLKYAFYV